MKHMIGVMLCMTMLLAGCQTTYKGAVTLTQVVDSAMKGWAELSVAGKTTPSLDAAVFKAHAKYQQSCAVARKALEAYKAGGDQAQYVLMLEAARASAGDLFAMILPLFAKSEQLKLETQLRTVGAP